MMLNINKNRFYYILLSILIILFDQFTKHIIDINQTSYINKDLLFFSIDYVKNYGAAFNILDGNRIFLSTLRPIFIDISAILNTGKSIKFKLIKSIT